ncbi:two-component sensor histidine kinase [Sphingobium sp. B1D7B]|uniref:sensor histidine kinase n=1 Tax=Sphingobium sp. B1D7B TaxID=2940578 RepID=UPI002224FEF4|nr:HWE histidine kinase domain-containing protein [Sphingobium sp. B1D7B]MCW2404604.1 two-component sensor histidine kinase [Sphingobium sp. B1D7B]
MVRLSSIKKAILTERSVGAKLIWTIFSVVAPTALRLAIDRGEAGVPFVTYFPAVVLASLFLGWKWATATAFFSAVVANRMFRPGFTILDFEAADFIMAGLFVFSCVILINIGEAIRRLLLDLELSHQRETMLNAELRHRAKNMLAIVQSMAVLTHRRSDPSSFLEDFSARIQAMARVTDMANADKASKREIGTLVDVAVAPFKDGANFTIAGPDWRLPQVSCIPLGLALHELCTNAVKYGALSANTGRVEIQWHTEEDQKNLVISWKERGGPCVQEPARRGMGSALLHAQYGIAKVEHLFAPEGVECKITIHSEGQT